MVQGVLKKLADARLVTTGHETVEVAHEALIQEWVRLRDWLNERRAGLRLHRQLTEAAQEWEIKGRPRNVQVEAMHLFWTSPRLRGTSQ